MVEKGALTFIYHFAIYTLKLHIDYTGSGLPFDTIY